MPFRLVFFWTDTLIYALVAATQAGTNTCACHGGACGDGRWPQGHW